MLGTDWRNEWQVCKDAQRQLMLRHMPLGQLRERASHGPEVEVGVVTSGSTWPQRHVPLTWAAGRGRQARTESSGTGQHRETLSQNQNPQPWQKYLEDGRLYLGSQVKGYSISWLKTGGRSLRAQRTILGLQSGCSWLSLLCCSRPNPTFGGLPTWVNQVWLLLRWHGQTFIF